MRSYEELQKGSQIMSPKSPPTFSPLFMWSWQNNRHISSPQLFKSSRLSQRINSDSSHKLHKNCFYCRAVVLDCIIMSDVMWSTPYVYVCVHMYTLSTCWVSGGHLWSLDCNDVTHGCISVRAPGFAWRHKETCCGAKHRRYISNSN